MTFKEKTFDLIGKNQKIYQDLIKYVDLIEETNKSLNLTGFHGDDIWREGIYQSILLMNESFSNLENKKMLDIGSGMGLPSIPFLIYKRNFSLYIAEPNLKRTNFLKKINEILSLDINFIIERVEDYKGDIKFDFITARAVTTLKNLIEISSKIGKINSEYSFLKGPKIYQELENSQWIINKLSIIPKINKVTMKINQEQTQDLFLLKYTKKTQTPHDFPRSWSVICSEK